MRATISENPAREELEASMAAFLQAGGKITAVEFGVSAYSVDRQGRLVKSDGTGRDFNGTPINATGSITSRTGRYSDETRDEWARLHTERGWSCHQIAEKYKCADCTVIDEMKRRGVFKKRAGKKA